MVLVQFEILIHAAASGRRLARAKGPETVQTVSDFIAVLGHRAKATV